ncbi:2OG-Fe(II) oxygenase family protein [Solemya elarraichensis gill symbiont]|uniref:2OG-Fe(II) oxygenase n=1 Tax=Solemya elarraichensis gill symbiont TaxID=1918949 RepID=A0A1T2L005_9GAMM|nr:2OG-Fe(II) oxygenase [Solemya elarraichensis gill symbiont]OOZ38402.1 2OG-Fe(II) oxygenase [Solemya elarraichensis gill symbiont]
MTTAFDKQVTPLRTISEVKPGSFIFSRDNALPADFCDEVVRRFEASESYQRKGVIGQLGEEDNGIKSTMDLVVSDKEDWKDIDQMFFRGMAAAMNEFRESFPYFKGPFKDLGYQVQRYLPGDYYHWHIDGGSHQFADRQLVALWYLNDVPEGAGGETQFLFQDISVRPEKGKLVLFPPFWTHEHRAAEVLSGAKYIATTWVLFR